MPQKKTVNTGRKRGGNSGHPICPRVSYFFPRLRRNFEKGSIEVNKNVVRGRFGQTEILKTQKEQKHYKTRGFKSLCRPKWRKGGNKKTTSQKKKVNCTKIPPSKPTSDSKTVWIRPLLGDIGGGGSESGCSGKGKMARIPPLSWPGFPSYSIYIYIYISVSLSLSLALPLCSSYLSLSLIGFYL